VITKKEILEKVKGEVLERVTRMEIDILSEAKTRTKKNKKMVDEIQDLHVKLDRLEDRQKKGDHVEIATLTKLREKIRTKERDYSIWRLNQTIKLVDELLKGKK